MTAWEPVLLVQPSLTLAKCCFIMVKGLQSQTRKFNDNKEPVCGLFAIAFASSLCFGNDPQEIAYAQPLLRSHFIACLEDHKMMPFPTTDRRVQRHLSVSKAVVPIYCTCRMPNDGDAYVQCHHCNDWWHLKYLNIPPWAVEFNNSWKCETCNKIKL